MIRYYDRDTVEIGVEKWRTLFRRDGYRQLARVRIGDTLVSTVWLGLDHRAGNGGPPLIFETKVFGGWLDMTVRRYSYEADARRGHERIVDLIRRYPKPPSLAERLAKGTTHMLSRLAAIAADD